MRTFFRVINSIFFTVALIAAAFCGYMVYSVMHYPQAEHDAEIADIKSQTEKTKTETTAALKEGEERLAFLQADLRNLGDEGVELADRGESLQTEVEAKQLRLAELEANVALGEDMPGSVEKARKAYADKIRELEEKVQNGETSVRICYWTLDDGPTYITKNFLDALDEMGEHVHVTFFTANEANNSPDEEEMLRREMTSGHSVQNHSYVHSTLASGSVYRSTESFREQVQQQDDWVYSVTGFHPTIFRFPGGYHSWGKDLLPGALDVLEEMGYKWIDWNCNLYDAGAEENLPTSSLEVTRALTQIPEEPIAVMLGHDWNMNTLVAMKTAIPRLMKQGYVFLPLFPESVTMGMNAKR